MRPTPSHFTAPPAHPHAQTGKDIAPHASARAPMMRPPSSGAHGSADAMSLGQMPGGGGKGAMNYTDVRANGALPQGEVAAMPASAMPANGMPGAQGVEYADIGPNGPVAHGRIPSMPPHGTPDAMKGGAGAGDKMRLPGMPPTGQSKTGHAQGQASGAEQPKSESPAGGSKQGGADAVKALAEMLSPLLKANPKMLDAISKDPSALLGALQQLTSGASAGADTTTQ